jgi:hypothetical protein
MALNNLLNKDIGRSLGLAYLTDVVAREGIRSIVPGVGIDVFNANPLNPTVSNTGIIQLTFNTVPFRGEVIIQGNDGVDINVIDGTTVEFSNSGVLSLQGLAGAITLSSSDDSLNFNNVGNFIDITSNGVAPVGGVSSLSDGITPLTGAITLIGEGCSINATQDPSPAITISVPLPPPSGVVSLNGVAGAMNLKSDGTIIIIPNVDTNTIQLNAVAGVSSISDGTNVLTGAITIGAGEGIEIQTEGNKITLSSDPFVGIYNLLTPQNLTAVALPWINNVIGLTPDAQTDTAVVSYDAGTGTWTVLKDGVYFLNFSAGIIQNDATWTLGSFCQCFMVVNVGASKYNICNSLTPSQTSGVSSFNGQVFGYIPLTVGSTITCGFQWYLTAVGATVAQFQPRTNGINNGTNFNWAYVKPLTA